MDNDDSGIYRVADRGTSRHRASQPVHYRALSQSYIDNLRDDVRAGVRADSSGYIAHPRENYQYRPPVAISTFYNIGECHAYINLAHNK